MSGFARQFRRSKVSMAESDIFDDNIFRLAPRARPSISGQFPHRSESAPQARLVGFNRAELRLILNLYGRQVAAGEWRDYSIDFDRDRATFSVMRRTSEVPVYRIEKVPALARRQGAFSVVSVTGFILKRGHDLRQVLSVLEPAAKLRPA
jgi:hypothetical protein